MDFNFAIKKKTQKTLLFLPSSTTRTFFRTTTTTSTTAISDYFDDDYEEEEIDVIDDSVSGGSFISSSSPSLSLLSAGEKASPFSNENAPLLWTLTILYLGNLFAAILLNVATFKQLAAKRSKHVRFVTNPYVACLLVTNVLWPAINIPFSLVQTWTPYWHFGRITCKLFPVIQMCFPDAISLTLCLIAIERYLSIIHPFRPNPLLKKTVATTALTFVWLIPLCLNAILAISHDQLEFDDDNYVCTVAEQVEQDGEEDEDIIYFTTSQAYFTRPSAISSQFIESYKVVQSTVVLLVIPGILLPFCYGTIICKVFAMKTPEQKQKSNSIRSSVHFNPSSASITTTGTTLLPPVTVQQRSSAGPGGGGGGGNTNAERRKRSVTMLSILCALVHFVCWTPIVVFQSVHFFRRYPTLTGRELIFLRLFILLASTNPTLNSLLYAAALYRDITRSFIRRFSMTPSSMRQPSIRLNLKEPDEDQEMKESLQPQPQKAGLLISTTSADDEVFDGDAQKPDEDEKPSPDSDESEKIDDAATMTVDCDEEQRKQNQQPKWTTSDSGSTVLIPRRQLSSRTSLMVLEPICEMKTPEAEQQEDDHEGDGDDEEDKDEEKDENKTALRFRRLSSGELDFNDDEMVAKKAVEHEMLDNEISADTDDHNGDGDNESLYDNVDINGEPLPNWREEFL